MKLKNNKGFTLIELLVVISIIGFISSVTIVSMNSAREKARLARARKDVQTLKTAIIALSIDTGKGPNGCKGESNDSLEVFLNQPWGGLASLNGSIPGPDNDALDNNGMSPMGAAYGNQSDPIVAPGSCGWTVTDLPKWRGPYATNLIDPWGTPYQYDADFNFGSPNCVVVTMCRPVVRSYGPDKVIQDIASNPNTDDIWADLSN